MAKRNPPIHVFDESVPCVGDLMPGERLCRIRICRTHNMFERQFDRVPHFSVGIGTNGGMAFPEVLRAYSRLFAKAAEKMEQDPDMPKEPIDFQI